MQNLVINIIFWFVVALMYAWFEIELEGKYGWSEKTQTWYRSYKSYPKWLRVFLGKKPLTGYHAPAFMAVFLIAHMHFVMGVPWTWHNELVALATYLAWAPLWDYLWLLFNPYYGIHNIGPKKVWWYQDSYWVGGVVPIENLIQWGLTLVLATIGGFLPTQVLFLGGLSLLTIVSTLSLAPIFKRWNRHMHQTDDRENVNIFHRE